MSARGTPPPLAVLVVVAVLCAGLGYLVGSWSAVRPAAPEPWLARLADDLGLRPDQVAAIDGLLADEDADLEELAAHHRDRLREPVAARREQTEQAMLALLDAEQRATYERLTRP